MNQIILWSMEDYNLILLEIIKDTQLSWDYSNSNNI